MIVSRHLEKPSRLSVGCANYHWWYLQFIFTNVLTLFVRHFLRCPQLQLSTTPNGVTPQKNWGRVIILSVRPFLSPFVLKNVEKYLLNGKTQKDKRTRLQHPPEKLNPPDKPCHFIYSSGKPSPQLQDAIHTNFLPQMGAGLNSPAPAPEPIKHQKRAES